MGCKVTKHDRAEFLNVKGISDEKAGIEKDEETSKVNGRHPQDNLNTTEKSSALSEKAKEEDHPQLSLPLQVPEELFSNTEHFKRVSINGSPVKIILCTPNSCSIAEACDTEQIHVYKTTWVRVKYKGTDGFVQQHLLPPSAQSSSQRLEKKRSVEEKDDKKKSSEHRQEPQAKSQKAMSSRTGNAERYARIRLWLDRMPYPSVPCVVKESSESFELTQAALQKNMQLIRQNQEDKLASSISPSSHGAQ
eukprot:TRINITY_DN21070_c0_g1_i1.p1 TRINITY_DN21070_c0_g1~~TRINITY_DN21070_c0_g1_i1.p1  ORF type:complete len:249 (+),score=38.09 TRINITY_DN21070_c0_g1_i1:69-815(+)